MFGQRILEFFNRETMPNRFSLAMGQLIKEAREEVGMSQAELAESIYKRRPSVSEMENGKMFPDIQSLLLMSYFLGKPITYFIPKFARSFPADSSELTDEEEEVLFQYRRIRSGKQREFALSQIRSIADFENPKTAAG